MRICLIILMMVSMAPAVFSQKMLKKSVSPFLPKSFLALDKVQKDSMEQVLLYKNWKRSHRSTPYVPEYKDQMPNALKEKVQAMIYRRNNGRGGSIYQSPVDNMLMLAPDSSAEYNMPNGSVYMVPIKP